MKRLLSILFAAVLLLALTPSSGHAITGNYEPDNEHPHVGVGTLDALATARGRQDLTVTASGYGLSYSSPVAVESFRSRLMAEGRITNLRSHNNAGFNVQTNGNGKGKGGTCSGDSGGPIFLGGYESNLVVAVTSFGLNSYCRGVDFSYRVDTAAGQAWILATVAASSAAADEADLIVID